MLRRRLTPWKRESKPVNNAAKIIYMCTSSYVFLTDLRIVGKGIHSQNHLIKLKPAIEDLCQKHHFKYYVEDNDGRILIKFGEGSGQLSQGEAQNFWSNLQNYGGTQSGYPGSSQPQYPQPTYQQNQYQGQQHQQQYQSNQNNDLVEEVVRKAAPVVVRKLRSCCIIM